MTYPLTDKVQAWDMAWERSSLPDGLVTLWIAVFTADGRLLAAAPVTGPPRWEWRGGQLAYFYGNVRMNVLAPGILRAGWIVAVSEETRHYRLMFPFPLEHKTVSPGDQLCVTDGRIVLQ